MNDDRFVRAVAFEREMLRRSSTSVEPFAFGTVYLNRDLPHRWSSNLLWIDIDAQPPDAGALAAEADAILGGAGYAHRKLIANGETGAALATGFLQLGWTVHRLSVMTLERPPDRLASVPVDRVGYAEARPLVEEVSRRVEEVDDVATLQELIGHKAVMERSVRASFFVARVDGRQAGVCELYVDGEAAQIEDVNTLEEYRGRGVARSVVLAAAEAGRAAGAHLIFLVADEDDWPKDLYRRLGFEPVGPEWEYLRRPTV
jgi:ribosomal protein S18 acetylase RimI-like enzyme